MHVKIGIIAPIIERVPPKKYGCIERVVYAQTEELVRNARARTSAPSDPDDDCVAIRTRYDAIYCPGVVVGDVEKPYESNRRLTERLIASLPSAPESRNPVMKSIGIESMTCPFSSSATRTT